MQTPYQILDISDDSNDTEIKQAYLQKVKDNPPEKAEEKFQLIHNAYTAIKDIKSRTCYELFNNPTTDFNNFIDQALLTKQALKITPGQFNKLLFSSIDESTIQNTFANSEQ